MPLDTLTCLTLRNLTHVFTSPAGDVTALRDISLDFEPGSWTAIMGPSGSGKSTLLNCASGLIRPSAGSVHLGETELTTASESQLAELRRTEIGFVFQEYNLIRALTAEQNVALPTLFDGRKPKRGRLRELLVRVGLGEKARARPGELSGGQRQRVAVARALSIEPSVVFADEPTGALDRRSGRAVLAEFRQLAEAGAAIVMVTHDPTVAAAADRVLILVDGAIVDELHHPASETISSRLATWDEDR